jgi:hypothetical protein
MEKNRRSRNKPMCSNSYLTFDKGAKNIHWRKDSHFQQMVLRKLGICNKTETTRGKLRENTLRKHLSD